MAVEEDKMQKYLAQRAQFAEIKRELLAAIREKRTVGQDAADLERQLDGARPRTEKGVFFCAHCDLISIAYAGESEDKNRGYKCEICSAERKFGEYNNIVGFQFG